MGAAARPGNVPPARPGGDATPAARPDLRPTPSRRPDPAAAVGPSGRPDPTATVGPGGRPNPAAAVGPGPGGRPDPTAAVGPGGRSGDPVEGGTPGRPGETSQTLDRGLRLLHLVADAQGGLTVTEAAQRLGIGRAAVYRLVSALTGHGMLRRDRAGRLRLGAGVLHLARRAQPLLAEGALPALRRLAEQAGATAHLTVVEGDEGVALAVVEPSWTAFHVAYRTGSRHPLERGAAGRAILAGRAGSAGPVTTEGELQPGAYGVAAPVLGVPGLEASVGVVALAPLDAATVGGQVLTAATTIARALS